MAPADDDRGIDGEWRKGFDANETREAFMNEGDKQTYRTVLIIGGYGPTGSHLVRLLCDKRIVLLIGGRDFQKSSQLCAKYKDQNAILTPVCFDYASMSYDTIKYLQPDIIVDASGALTLRFLELSQICSDLNIPFIDLSPDGIRKFRSQMVPEHHLDASIPCGLIEFLKAGFQNVLPQTGSKNSDVEVKTAFTLSKKLLDGKIDWWGFLDFLERPNKDGRIKEISIWSAKSYRFSRKTFFRLFTGNQRLGCSDIDDKCVVKVAAVMALPPFVKPLARWFPNAGIVFELAQRLFGERNFSELVIEAAESDSYNPLSPHICGVAVFGTDEQFSFLPSVAAAAAVLSDIQPNGRSAKAGTGLNLVFQDLEPFLLKAGLKHEYYVRENSCPTGSPFEQALGKRFTELAPQLQNINRLIGKADGQVTIVSPKGFWSVLLRLFAMRLPKSGMGLPFKVSTEPMDNGIYIRQVFHQQVVFGIRCSAGTEDNCGLVLLHSGPFTFALALVPSSREALCGTTKSYRLNLKLFLDHWSFYNRRLPGWLAPTIQIEQHSLDDRIRFSVLIAHHLLNFSILYSGWIKLIDDN